MWLELAWNTSLSCIPDSLKNFNILSQSITATYKTLCFTYRKKAFHLLSLFLPRRSLHTHLDYRLWADSEHLMEVFVVQHDINFSFMSVRNLLCVLYHPGQRIHIYNAWSWKGRKERGHHNVGCGWWCILVFHALETETGRPWAPGQPHLHSDIVTFLKVKWSKEWKIFQKHLIPKLSLSEIWNFTEDMTQPAKFGASWSVRLEYKRSVP